ncbi:MULTISPECIES: glycoside hydrolase family 13 protein [Clostridium]|uniref:Glycoside hydrolase family 13 protein n=1 Tax=Clostridium cibarium TaxID=2762247 RepID=A0ABR8PZ66_9CLOT|nr:MULTISPECIES: glycoside hydrolase family 13 protein [Clostridium]MBD7913457.1 glycoside hydrolase family 13 protein [Clostridium cibarium]
MEYCFAFHNSHINQYRSPFGAVAVGTNVNLKILVDKGVEAYLNLINFIGEESVVKMSWEGDSGNRTLFSTKLDTLNLIGMNRYYFSLKKDDKYFFYGNNESALGGEGRIYYENPIPYQITVYEESYIPEWFQEGIIYQIFADRFYNGNKDGKINSRKKNSFIYGSWNDEPMYIRDNKGSIIRWDFYGGNLRGVIEKLPYLEELGVTILYFNPIFESASSHKYDVGDYEKIDSMLGDEDDFKELCSRAEKHGIKVILDGVFSHIGADSKYFNKFGNYESLGAYQSKESPYYSWFRFKEYPDSYDCWWGFDNQPNVDELNPSYLNYIVTGKESIVSKWLKLGASGWRLDVADELPDEFIKLLKKRIREVNPESILVGEVWEDASNKISYSERREYLFGRELDSVTNYPFRESILKYAKGEINGAEFISRVYSLYENYPRDNFYNTMNLLGNHDTQRLFTILEEDISLLRFAIAIQMTFPGVPLIYYGDEVGLIGGLDPSNRKPYPWEKENKEVYDIYRKLIMLRKSNDILLKGDFDIYQGENDLVIVKRMYKNKSILIILNNTEEDKYIRIKENNNYKLRDIISGEVLVGDDKKKYNVKVKKKGYKILQED